MKHCEKLQVQNKPPTFLSFNLQHASAPSVGSHAQEVRSQKRIPSFTPISCSSLLLPPCARVQESRFWSRRSSRLPPALPSPTHQTFVRLKAAHDADGGGHGRVAKCQNNPVQPARAAALAKIEYVVRALSLALGAFRTLRQTISITSQCHRVVEITSGFR